MKKICKDCGKEFELSYGEIQFYNSKNLELPKRCKECRDKKNKKDSKTHRSENRNNLYQEQQEQQDSTISKTIQPTTSNMQKSTSNLNSPNGKHRITTAIAAILILVASLFGGHFFQDGDGVPNNQNNENSNAAYINKQETTYTFRNDSYLAEHFEKHGEDFDYSTKEEYQAGANRVIASDDALHKLEAEDGDDVYYLEDSNEFVIVSTDGFIRTYFRPKDGIAYYNRQ